MKIKAISVWLLWFMLLKSIAIGFDFSFIDWLISGRKYTSWYFSRSTWADEKGKAACKKGEE